MLNRPTRILFYTPDFIILLLLFDWSNVSNIFSNPFFNCISIFSNDSVVCLLHLCDTAAVAEALGEILLCLEILTIACLPRWCPRCLFEGLRNTCLCWRNNFPDAPRYKTKTLCRNCNFYDKKSRRKKTNINFKRKNCRCLNGRIITLVLIMLRLMRLNFRFRDQYMNGFQKLLLNAIHVITKSTAGGICTRVQVTKQKLYKLVALSHGRVDNVRCTYFRARTRCHYFLNCPRGHGHYETQCDRSHSSRGSYALPQFFRRQSIRSFVDRGVLSKNNFLKHLQFLKNCALGVIWYSLYSVYFYWLFFFSSNCRIS